MNRYELLVAASKFDALLREYPKIHFIGNCDLKLPVKKFLKNKNNVVLSMNRTEEKTTKKHEKRSN